MESECLAPSLRARLGLCRVVTWNSGVCIRHALHPRTGHPMLEVEGCTLARIMTSLSSSLLYTDAVLQRMPESGGVAVQNVRETQPASRHDDWKDALSRVTARAGYSNRVEPGYNEVGTAAPGRAGSRAVPAASVRQFAVGQGAAAAQTMLEVPAAPGALATEVLHAGLELPAAVAAPPDAVQREQLYLAARGCHAVRCWPRMQQRC